MRGNLFILFLGVLSTSLFAQVCDFEQAAADRANLIVLYQALGVGISPSDTLDVNNILISFDPTGPIEDFYGFVAPNLADLPCVRCLDLDGVLGGSILNNTCAGCVVASFTDGSGIGLSTGWPEEVELPLLEKLSLAGNDSLFTDSELPNFSLYPRLCELRLKRTGLSEQIDWSKLELLNLQILDLVSNEITGGIPTSISQLTPNLRELYFSENNLSEPISFLSSLDILELRENRLTFEDVLAAYLAYRENGASISLIDQQPIYIADTILAPFGLPFSLPTGIDDTVTTNTYRWLRNGTLSRAGTTTNNVMTLDTLRPSDTAGLYRLQITNSIIPPGEMTLNSQPFRILGCQPGIRAISGTICAGSNLVLENGLVFSGDSIHYLPERAANGCDSVITVNLDFYSIDTLTIDTLLCDGETYLLNGEEYELPGNYSQSIAHPIFPCDSIINISLNFVDDTWPLAELAEDTIHCANEILLTTNNTSRAETQWTVPSASWLTLVDEVTVRVENLDPGYTAITQTLSAGSCRAYSTDTILIYYQPPLVANNDTLNLVDGRGSPLINSELNLLVNDINWEWIFRNWSVDAINSPDAGTIIDLTPEGQLVFEREPCRRGIFSFQYQIGSDFCPMDTAEVIILITPENYLEDIPPDIITPNGDGKNDRFVIPLIERNPAAFPNSTLTIYSNHGQVVYQQFNYDNQWSGTDFGGTPLPGGRYQYSIDYGDEQTPEHRGRLTVAN